MADRRRNREKYAIPFQKVVHRWGLISCPLAKTAEAEFIHKPVRKTPSAVLRPAVPPGIGLSLKTWPPAVDGEYQGEYQARISSLYADAPRRNSMVAFPTPTTSTPPCASESVQAGATSDSSRTKSTPGTSSRLGGPCLVWSPSKLARPNMVPPIRRSKVPARPQVSGAPTRQGSQIPGSPQTRGTKTKYP
jgi:hypothetical protein